MADDDVARFAEGLRSRIEAEYETLGYREGWRLLYSPLRVLKGAEVAFIGLNPGGRAEGSEAHGDLATADGVSAYRDEVWKPPREPGQEKLQQQVLAVFERLAVAPEEVLAGNLVPFRSEDWERLGNASAAIAFGRSLWGDIFRRCGVPPTVVTMGKQAFTQMARILGAGDVTPVGYAWGRETASKAAFPGGRLIGLPHLSRRPIMRHASRQMALDELFS